MDKLRVLDVVKDVLSCERVVNGRKKAAEALKARGSGSVDEEAMEWVDKDLRSPRGRRGLEERHGGLEVVGWGQRGTPMDDAGNVMGSLLRRVSVGLTF